ncbi:MAG TPA: ribbon-helix-helix domain-containing protein [Candidatus Nanoarchaeia archaeon]|nr:ribbon-helix-helix domain-containing protein [Candidatus Nanoarchaeia archaeon]
MKHKISITVEEKILEQLERHLQTGRYRNTSHAFEYALQELLKEKKT